MVSIDAFMQHLSALVGPCLQISKVYCGKNEKINFSQLLTFHDVSKDYGIHIGINLKKQQES